MKTKSVRFIYSTMTSSLFLSLHSSDDSKYDVSKSRSIVMICIRWTSSWWLILRSKSFKNPVFFIIVWNSRLYLSVIFRNLFPFDLKSWSSKNRSIIHWFWKNTQDELIILRNSWRHSSSVVISFIKVVMKNAKQMLIEYDLDLEYKIMNWLKVIKNLHYWILYQYIKELFKWRSMICKNEWDFYYN